ncbi:MAG: hypothetical protein ACREJ2_02575 [Planctomycetota bacterium]
MALKHVFAAGLLGLLLPVAGAVEAAPPTGSTTATQLAGQATQAVLPSDSKDIVILKAHEEKLFGKIVLEQPTFILFDATTANSVGRMRIDRDKILSITYALTRQAEGLKDADVDGWFALAKKAYEAGYWSLSYDWLTKVGAMLPKDPQGDMRNTFKYAGKAADYQAKYQDALTNYVAHLALNPNDKEISDRVQQIRDYLGIVDPKDAAKKKTWPDGMESVPVYRWQVENWGQNNVGTVSDQVQPHGLDGDDHILAITFDVGKFDKLVLGDRRANSANFTGMTKLKMLVSFKTSAAAKGPGQPVGIGLAFKSPASPWMECNEQSVQASDGTWTELTFKLDGDTTFKTKATGWAFKSALLQPDQIQTIFILVHNRGVAGTLYINNMGVE